MSYVSTIDDDFTIYALEGVESKENLQESPLETLEPESHKHFICRQCGHTITAEKWQIQVKESHEHLQCNPFGITFIFGCFSHAPGCSLHGVAQDAYSWFPGFFWQIACCEACGEHLGWSFRAEQEHFFGIILQRIRLVGTDHP